MLPVAERELRTAARQPRTYRSRLAFAAASVCIFGWMVWLMRYGRGPNGSEMFAMFSWLAFVYCLFTGAAVTADSISSEKRENTLGLLFLTHLRGYDVIFGKLLSSSLSCFFGLLAMFPVMAIPLMMGGVQLAEFWRIVLNLGNTLLLSISVGLLVSTLSRHPLRGSGLAFLSLALMSFGLAGLAELVRGYYKLPAWADRIELFSPFACQFKAFASTFWIRSNSYWASLLTIHLTAVSFLILACWLVPQSWKDKPGSKRVFTWRERLRRWRFGSASATLAFRRRLLELNPFFWRAARERVSSLEFVLFLVLFVGLATWVAWRVGQQMGVPLKPLGGFVFVWGWAAVILHGLLLVRMAIAASHRLAEDRRSGALELLLATPFEARRVVRGAWLAMARQMAAPVLIVLLAQAFFLWGLSEIFLIETAAHWGARTRWEVLQALWTGSTWMDGEMLSVLTFICSIILSITVLLAIHWMTLGWVGMWMGIRSKRPRTAPWVTLALVMIPPWPIFIFLIVWLEPLAQLWAEFQFLFFCLGIGVGLGLLHNAILTFWAWRKLRRFFRMAVTDRSLFLSLRRTWAQRARLAALFVVGIACTAGLFLLWHKFENWRGLRAWKNFEKELQASGTNIDLKSISPPVVHVTQNFAAAQIFTPLFPSFGGVATERGRQNRTALETINLEGQSQGGPRNGDVGQGNWREQKPMNATALQKHFRGRIQFPKAQTELEPAAEVLFALDKFDSELDEFRMAAAQRPLSHIPGLGLEQLQLRYGYAPHLVVWRNVTEVLQVRACALLAAGKTGESFDDVQLIIRFADALRQERYVQSQRIRYEIIGFAIQVVWDGLTSRQWSQEQLAWLQKKFQEVEPLADYQKSIWAETILQMEAWHRFRSSVSGDWSHVSRRDRRQRILKFIFPAGWTYDRAIRVYRFYESFMVPVADVERQRVFMEKVHLLKRSLETADAFTENRDVKWVFNDFAHDAARAQVSADQTEVACALERFRIARGDYPEDLTALAPEFIDAIPRDVVNGGALRYEQTGDERFVLYSVGPNEKDDGGISRNELDWVWRYPRN